MVLVVPQDNRGQEDSRQGSLLQRVELINKAAKGQERSKGEIMGVDLRLLPFDSDQGDWAYSHTMFEVGRDYDLHDKIRGLPQMPVPGDFTTFSGRRPDYDEVCYGQTQTTPYGEPVLYALASHLTAIKLPPDASARLKAAWAYLKCLPPQTKVALYWH